MATDNTNNSHPDATDHSSNGAVSGGNDASHKMALDANLTSKDVDQFFNNNFPALDHDKTGAITIGELDAFKPANAQDAKSLQYLKDNLKDIQSLNFDGLFTSGITKADMDQFAIQNDPNYASRSADMQHMSDNFKSLFNKLDQDGNGRLNKAELEVAASNPSLSADEKREAQFLAQGFDKLTADLHGAFYDRDPKLGFSRHDMDTLNQDFSVAASKENVDGNAFLGSGIGAVSLETAGAAATFTALSVGTTMFVAGMAAPAIIGGVAGYYYEKEKTLNENNAIRADISNTFDALDKGQM